MWENLSREFLIFYHSFTHFSSHHHALSLRLRMRKIHWEYFPVNWLASWVKDPILPSTSVSKGHEVFYISLHYEKQPQIYAFITTYKRKKNTTNSTTDGPLTANQRKNPETYFCFSQFIYDLECFIFYICSNTGMHLKFAFATQIVQ